MKVVSYESLRNYRRSTSEIDPKIFKTVQDIIDHVRQDGDKAVLDYTRKFDRVTDKNFSLIVTEDEKSRARDLINKEQKELFGYFMNAAENIRVYHEKQLEKGWSFEKDKCVYGQMIKPIERAGVYVPGGKAFYPSTILMDVIPAKTAGVKEIILTSPPSPAGEANPFLIALADSLGVNTIVKAGGAQAVAALAYGSESIPAVSKIVGPGNIYVAAAKRLLNGMVGIDSIAGPSEVIIFADDTADPEWVAVDLCAQAEHDENATAILVTTSQKLIKAVFDQLETLVPRLTRKSIIAESLHKNALAVIVENLDQGFDIVNRLAPEHIEVQLALEDSIVLGKIQNAGAIFLGKWTPVATGDYYAGTNHVLPTYGTAVFSSPLGVYDFTKRMSYLSLSEDYLKAKGDEIAAMADSEGFEAHGLSVKVRTGK